MTEPLNPKNPNPSAADWANGTTASSLRENQQLLDANSNFLNDLKTQDPPVEVNDPNDAEEVERVRQANKEKYHILTFVPPVGAADTNEVEVHESFRDQFLFQGYTLKQA